MGYRILSWKKELYHDEWNNYGKKELIFVPV